MAQIEHILKLMAGVEAWNQWRAENPEVVPDLSGVNLSGKVLADVDFSGAQLNGAQFSSADLQGANLKRAKLIDSNLENARLVNVSLREAILRHAHLKGADLSGADLTEADLGGATLSNAILQNARFVRSRISGAQFSGAVFDRHAVMQAIGWEGAYFDQPLAVIPSDEYTDSEQYARDESALFIEFSENLTPEQVQGTLQALAEYYRACGGLGLLLDTADAQPTEEWRHA